MTTAAGILKRLPGATIWTPGLKTGGTFLAFAGMAIVVVVLKAGLALDAKLILTQEAWERVTPVVVLTHFDEYDLFGLRRTLEDDLVLVVHGQDDDLMVGEMSLKRLEFGQPVRPFGNAGLTMELSGLPCLNGSGPAQTDVLRMLTTKVAVGFHGHNGACAAQFILIIDPDDTLLGVQYFFQGHTAFTYPVLA